eukprot:m.308294 g.308294  ORF g.308294 m.308294 type:complete len:130 (-) comp16472_c1_seq3:21-410(-)
MLAEAVDVVVVTVVVVVVEVVAFAQRVAAGFFQVVAVVVELIVDILVLLLSPLRSVRKISPTNFNQMASSHSTTTTSQVNVNTVIKLSVTPLLLLYKTLSSIVVYKYNNSPKLYSSFNTYIIIIIICTC